MTDKELILHLKEIIREALYIDGNGSVYTGVKDGYDLCVGMPVEVQATLREVLLADA